MYTSRMAAVFSKFHGEYVVGMVDVIHSTGLVSELSAKDTDAFFTLFLTHYDECIRHTGARVVKNVGDGFLFYLSGTPENYGSSALACARAILSSVDELNAKLREAHLPEIAVRLSMSYGPVSAMLDERGGISDIFGSTVSTCVKMNKMAEPNTVVIGSNLATYLRPLAEMKEIGEFKIKEGLSFPVFELQSPA